MLPVPGWVSTSGARTQAVENARVETLANICTANAERMARTDNAIYTHPMPIDRGSEVTDEVASGPRSAIYDIAENRLHVQKAVMALTMGNL